MIDIYDKESEGKYVECGEFDVDSNGSALTLAYLHYLWQRLVGQAETEGQIDWSEVKIKSHPIQFSYFESNKLSVDEDWFKVFENFQGNIKWDVDESICRDMLQMKIGKKMGTIIRLHFTN